MEETSLAVGDPRRIPIGRGIVHVLLACALFVAFAFVAKQVPRLYLHTPWMDDPYDAVVSFTIFFVPLVSVLVFLRAFSCLKKRPLPLRRVREMVRACKVALAGILVTLLAYWVSTALRANHQAWNTATFGLIGALALLTLLVGAVGQKVRSVSRLVESLEMRTGPEGDWLADIAGVLEDESYVLGPLRRLASSFGNWLKERAAPVVRKHPVGAALAVAVVYGLGLAVTQSIGEGITRPNVALLFFGVSACGMYAFGFMAGRYIAFLPAGPRSHPVGRLFLRASIAAAASVPVVAAFRGSLRGAINLTGAGSALRLLTLLAVSACFIFVAALVIQAVWMVLTSSRPRTN